MTLMEPAVAPPTVGTSRCFRTSQKGGSHTTVIQQRDPQKKQDMSVMTSVLTILELAKTGKSSELDSCDGPLAHSPQT